MDRMLRSERQVMLKKHSVQNSRDFVQAYFALDCSLRRKLAGGTVTRI